MGHASVRVAGGWQVVAYSEKMEPCLQERGQKGQADMAAVQDFLGAASAGNIYLQQKYTSSALLRMVFYCLTENGVLLPY